MLNPVVSHQLAFRDEHHLLRQRKIISERTQNKILIDGQPCLNFASNDYLGLSIAPEVKSAFIQGAERYGVGSGASALISGYYSAQAALEEKFSAFLNREKSLYFNSGYAANNGLMQALFRRDDTLISDQLVHASLLDGIHLSRAKHRRFEHNDTADLAALMDSLSSVSAVVTESVFSMTGDIAPIESIATLSQRKGALLIVDDAHGFGVLGKNGRGIAECTTQTIDCLVTPLGKAGGTMGAIVSGSKDLIEAIFQFARSYHFTTALPPAMAQASLQSLELIEQETWRREKLNHLIAFFIEESTRRNLILLSTDLTPIKAFRVSSNEAALAIQTRLLQKGFYIGAIRPPTVPEGNTCIRISLNCLHEEAEIIDLLDEVYKII
jgi:8-amino-7-oxononanoate synthase